MSYLIDTCIISEFVKRKPNNNVRSWFNHQQETQLLISAISIAEIKKGIYKIKPSQPERALKLQRWLNTLELSFSQRILPVNDDVLEQWAQLSASMERQGKTLAVMDSLIAATAHHYDLTIATRNTNDFNALPLKLVNPFEAVS
ncbi:MAG: PIN domain-containing protein [Methyloprofundus sp.]|nr:PIN domain-containing protein [Methyloprofundus sp.]